MATKKEKWLQSRKRGQKKPFYMDGQRWPPWDDTWADPSINEVESHDHVITIYFHIQVKPNIFCSLLIIAAIYFYLFFVKNFAYILSCYPSNKCTTLLYYHLQKRKWKLWEVKTMLVIARTKIHLRLFWGHLSIPPPTVLVRGTQRKVLFCFHFLP